MKTRQGIISGVWLVVLTVLFCVMMFVSCVGNGEYVSPVQEGDMSNKTWSMEDFPGKFGTFADEGLDAQTEFQILHDFLYSPDIPFFNMGRNYLEIQQSLQTSFELAIEHRRIWAFYGIYSDYFVVDIIALGYTDRRARPSVKIAGGQISQTSGSQTIAWKDRQVYSLQALAEQGKLTQDDVRNIARLHPMWR